MKALYPKRLPKMLPVEIVSYLLGVHPNTLRNWDRQGIFPAVRIGTRRDRRWPKEEVLKIVQGKSAVNGQKV